MFKTRYFPVTRRENEMSAWNPLMDLQREVDQVFSSFMQPSSTGTVERDSFFTPACDVEDKGDHLLLSFDVPGMKKDDIKIEVHNGTLLVSGERKQESEKKEGSVFRKERSYGRFERSFTIPEGTDIERIEANYENGVLMLAIPKAEEAKPKTVQIGENKSGFLRKLVNATASDQRRVS
jgi:HSP20 family protein